MILFTAFFVLLSISIAAWTLVSSIIRDMGNEALGHVFYADSENWVQVVS
jgi:hypothetical protein